MKVGTRAQRCPKCDEPADINEMEYAQCANDDCDVKLYLPVAKWNTEARIYKMYHKDKK